MKNLPLIFSLSIFLLFRFQVIGQTNGTIEPFNVHAVYALGVQIGALEIAAKDNAPASFTDLILDYAISAAKKTKCVSAAPIELLRSQMKNAASTISFAGRIGQLRDEVGNEVFAKCTCAGQSHEEAPLSWFWPVESTHPWFGLSIHRIREQGFKEEIFSGSMTWGFVYYLKDPNGNWVRLDANGVHYVNWDNFKQLYTFVRKEDLPNDRANSHQDVWKKNDNGQELKLTYLEKLTEWFYPAEGHPWSGKNIYQIRQMGYKEKIWNGSQVWGFKYFLKDQSGHWVRIDGNKVFYVNWDNFKMLYTFVRTDQLNSRTDSHQDVWKHNKTGHEFHLVYLK